MGGGLQTSDPLYAFERLVMLTCGDHQHEFSHKTIGVFTHERMSLGVETESFLAKQPATVYLAGQFVHFQKTQDR